LSRQQLQSAREFFKAGLSVAAESLILAQLALVLATVLAGLLGFPWWSLSIPALLLGSLRPLSRAQLITSSLAPALVWMAVAIFYDWQTGFRTSARLSEAFSLPLPALMYVMTGLIAMLTASLSVLCGQRLLRLKVRLESRR